MRHPAPSSAVPGPSAPRHCSADSSPPPPGHCHNCQSNGIIFFPPCLVLHCAPFYSIESSLPRSCPVTSAVEARRCAAIELLKAGRPQNVSLVDNGERERAPFFAGRVGRYRRHDGAPKLRNSYACNPSPRRVRAARHNKMNLEIQSESCTHDDGRCKF